MAAAPWPPNEAMNVTQGTIGLKRYGLDQLVRMLVEPCFALGQLRPSLLTERPGHVSAAMLGLSSPRSRYVRRWRRHARSCPSCAMVFRFNGYTVD